MAWDSFPLGGKWVVVRQRWLRTSLRLSNKGSSVPSRDSGATTSGSGGRPKDRTLHRRLQDGANPGK